MDIKEEEKELVDIINLNEGMSLMITLPTSIDFGINLGLCKISVEDVLKGYEDASNKQKLEYNKKVKEIAKSNDLEDIKKDKLTVISESFNNEMKDSLKTKYKVKCPTISKGELKKFHEEYKDSFVLTNEFYMRMNEYIID